MPENAGEAKLVALPEIKLLLQCSGIGGAASDGGRPTADGHIQ